jgi:histidine triad (HIT) family protein
MPTDASCLFCKIIAGTIPCHRVHEDAHTLAFLDIGPLSRGHMLVIPKGHYATLDQMPENEAAACAAVMPRLGRALRTVTRCAGWNVLQNNGSVAGQVVHHVHFHLIPRAEGDALGYRWPAGKLDGDEAKALLAAIKAAM